MTKPVNGHVFISYCHEDQAIADHVARMLDKANPAWRASDSLRAGSEYREKIDDAIRSASVVILLLTRKALKSPWVTYEWSFAIGALKPLIPVEAEPNLDRKLHPRLEALHRIDLSDLRKELDLALSAKPIKRTKRRPLPTDPTLFARLVLDRGHPKRVENEYHAALWVKNAHPGTQRVKYEVHDETFRKPRWSEDTPEGGFQTDMQSSGDVFLSARGVREGKSAWRTQTTLGQALHRGHPSARGTIRSAIEDIERH